MKSLALQKFIRIILIGYAVLGAIYSVTTPIFEASDEVSHYAVIQNIIDGYGLPVQQPGVKTTWAQEGSQPPLYYLLMAFTTKWIETSDAADRMYRNPHAAPGDPSLDANRNLVIHSSTENFPWRQTTLAVHFIRILSIAMGALTVLLGYQIARRIFPDRPSIAVGTAALIAFNPMFLFISASVNNDNLTILLSSAAIYVLIICWQETNVQIDRAGWLRRIALAVILGALALSKISGLTLLPVAGLILTLRHLRQRDWNGWIVSGLILSIGVIAIAGWWYLRNQQLYGDVFGLNMMVAIAGARVPMPTLAQLISEFDGFRYSYWALFGAVNVVTFPIAYVIFDVFLLAAVIGWCVWLLRAWRRSDRGPFTLMASLVVYALIVFVGVVRWTMQTPASQGRLMFPAIAVISLGLWLGWETIWSFWQKKITVGRWSMPAFLLLISIVIPFQAILPVYAPPIFLTEAQLPADLNPLQVDYGQTLRLIGYQLPGSPSVDRSIQFTLYWQCRTRPMADYSVFVIAYGRDLTEVGKRDAYPNHGQYATRECEPGAIFADPYQLPIDPNAVQPTVVQVQIGLKDWSAGVELKPSIDGKAIPALIFVAGKIPPSIDPQVSQIDLARFGDSIALKRIDLPAVAHSNQTLSLKFYWQAKSAISESYTVFVHVLDSQGNIVAQADGVPVKNFYPTNWWTAGEVIEDERQITLKPGMAGQYRMTIGLYRLADLTRLPAMDQAGQLQPDNQLILSNVIQVGP
jgi:hypothetical protein